MQVSNYTQSHTHIVIDLNFWIVFDLITGEAEEEKQQQMELRDM